jgi:hypothetical protein
MNKLFFLIMLTAKLAFSAVSAVEPVLFCLTPDTELLSAKAISERITGIPELDSLLTENPELRIRQWLPASEPHEFVGDIYLNRIYQITGYTRSKSGFEKELTRLSSNPKILYTEKEPLIRAHSYPSDPRTETTYSPDDPLYANQWWIRQIEADKAWGLWDIAGGDRPGSKQIIVAIVDTGVEWTHPDLIDNIWRNLGEDSNGNGDVLVNSDSQWQFDPGDLNNIDNDNNGFKDDLIGWDPAGSTGGNEDNNPMAVKQGNAPSSARMHGTHCAGIVSATSDNGIGIAGTAYDVSVMPVKAMADNDENGYLYYGYQGIQYAYKAGAQIISLSWGSSSYSSSARTVVQTARNAGSILIAAAGNGTDDGTELYGRFYPASYPEVISVTALGPNDKWGKWANYHEDVDIAAPGESIMSTVFSSVGSGYQSWWGTSMATPVVAGSMALLMSYLPGQGSQWYIDQLLNNTDEIYSINSDPEYAGRLGRGRVNPYKSIASILKPQFIIHDKILSVLDDDGDNVLNPGESLNINLTLQNQPGWQNGKNIRAVLRSNDEQILVIDSLATFPDLSAGQTGTHTESITVTALSGAVPGIKQLEFHVYSENSNGSPFTDILELPINVSLYQKGFPVPLSEQIVSSVLVWDINNDGRKEIVAGTIAGKIMAWNDEGDTLPGFPVTTVGLIPGEIAAGDLNNNDTLEMVAATTTGNVIIFDGWGKVIATYKAANSIVSSPTIGQVDGGNDLEIVVGTTGNQIIALKRDGSVIPGFPLNVGSAVRTSVSVAVSGNLSPVLAYSTSGGNVNLTNAQGESLPGWPVNFPGKRATTPVIVTYNGSMIVAAGLSDGSFVLIHENGTVKKILPGLSTVIAEPTLVRTASGPAFAYPYDIRKIALIDYDGNLFPGWPVIFDQIPSRVAAADLNNNGEDEIIAVSNNGKTGSWNLHGEMLPGFPLLLHESNSSGPTIIDLDGDGDAEIFVASSAQLVAWDIKSLSAANHLLMLGGLRGGGPLRNHRYDYTFTGFAEHLIPGNFTITGIYPNPFNPVTTVTWSQPGEGESIVTIYDLTGKEVYQRNISAAQRENTILIDGRGWSSGLYILRIKSGTDYASKRLIYLK